MVLRRTLARIRIRESSTYFRREKLKKGARTSTFRESSIEPMRKVTFRVGSTEPSRKVVL